MEKFKELSKWILSFFITILAPIWILPFIICIGIYENTVSIKNSFFEGRWNRY